ncbi:Hypothetical protein ORPV_1039 [Orpheovirus IHUMI-LCC2]|uniref:Uncharacterized protein n=1 Tax=Orpheovirus IHUMI-LCC2 TaxID=2023057 RepID=A0A2I2L5X7_9VIRU|nr:Hypothetical protein ORPV_1039 [Orpheovirus IHUMI-LCC2]SNW62943.1 Hypothetical protein ORPV_1039 [Orpheovirus IHUMI-LCC2]
MNIMDNIIALLQSHGANLNLCFSLYEDSRLIMDDDDECIEKSITLTKTQCYITSNLLLNILTNTPKIFHDYHYDINKTLYHNQHQNYESYRIYGIGCHNIINNLIDKFYNYKFLIINIEGIYPLYAGFHVLTLINKNDKVYVIQSFSEEYSLRVDSYDNIELLLNNISYMYDNKDTKIWKTLVHVEPTFDTSINDPIITFDFIKLQNVSITNLRNIVNKGLKTAEVIYPCLVEEIKDVKHVIDEFEF